MGFNGTAVAFGFLLSVSEPQSPGLKNDLTKLLRRSNVGTQENISEKAHKGGALLVPFFGLQIQSTT